ncbi:MAG: hypothetical protein HY319_01585 [Armatimonadetes bacterium]|nr:hypothetical protein [Armatimonadota bacterium]
MPTIHQGAANATHNAGLEQDQAAFARLVRDAQLEPGDHEQYLKLLRSAASEGNQWAHQVYSRIARTELSVQEGNAQTHELLADTYERAVASSEVVIDMGTFGLYSTSTSLGEAVGREDPGGAATAVVSGAAGMVGVGPVVKGARHLVRAGRTLRTARTAGQATRTARTAGQASRTARTAGQATPTARTAGRSTRATAPAAKGEPATTRTFSRQGAVLPTEVGQPLLGPSVRTPAAPAVTPRSVAPASPRVTPRSAAPAPRASSPAPARPRPSRAPARSSPLQTTAPAGRSPAAPNSVSSSSSTSKSLAGPASETFVPTGIDADEADAAYEMARQLARIRATGWR